MNGWVILTLLSVACLAAVIAIGKLPRAMWQVTAAAVLLGMSGYALQGKPFVKASPAVASDTERDPGQALVLMRADMDQSFGVAKRWLVTADSFSRVGDHQLAAAYIQSGLREHPRNADLWSALGVQLMLVSDGRMSTPAKLAFDKARMFNARHPAPDYFGGMADLLMGNVPSAKLKWQTALGLATPKAKWRAQLELQLERLAELQPAVAQSPSQP